MSLRLEVVDQSASGPIQASASARVAGDASQRRQTALLKTALMSPQRAHRTAEDTRHIIRIRPALIHQTDAKHFRTTRSRRFHDRKIYLRWRHRRVRARTRATARANCGRIDRPKEHAKNIFREEWQAVPQSGEPEISQS